MTAREAIVQEAMAWMNTPYHHAAGVKGAGVDCAFFLIRIYHAAGLIPDIDPRPYPHDWMLHRDEERYLGWVRQYADPLGEDEATQPGDIALYQFGRCVSHGAIVLDWPRVIHSYIGQGVRLEDASQAPLRNRLRAIYRLHALKDEP